ncbi:MAG: site-2 protease family protein [Clostridia bacterium]|nr:site-2 protease family protein [Clostridia bacterium]
MRNFVKSPLFILVVILVVLNIIEGDFNDPVFWIKEKLLLLPAIVIGLSFHEYAHGLASHLLGDPTPKVQGRLTLNPFKHFDGFGFLALLFAGFGWGIPVMIDPRYYKHPRRDELIVSLAGVTMNFIIAVLFTVLLKVIFTYNYNFGGPLLEIMVNIIYINIVLMIFNLLPIPPLDGFGVITQIFNLTKYSWYYPVYDKGFVILLIVVISGVLDKIMIPLISGVYNFLVQWIIYAI